MMRESYGSNMMTQMPLRSKNKSSVALIYRLVLTNFLCCRCSLWSCARELVWRSLNALSAAVQLLCVAWLKTVFHALRAHSFARYYTASVCVETFLRYRGELFTLRQHVHCCMFPIDTVVIAKLSGWRTHPYRNDASFIRATPQR